MVRYKVMTLTEFYEADAFDIDLVASNLEEVERDALERTRLMMWAALAPYSKNRQNPEDIMKFSWEQNTGKEPPAVTTKEQFDEFLKRFNKKE